MPYGLLSHMPRYLLFHGYLIPYFNTSQMIYLKI
jgi:hypothetical protein